MQDNPLFNYQQGGSGVQDRFAVGANGPGNVTTPQINLSALGIVFTIFWFLVVIGAIGFLIFLVGYLLIIWNLVVAAKGIKRTTKPKNNAMIKLVTGPAIATFNSPNFLSLKLLGL